MSLENNKLFRFADFTIDLAERTLWRGGAPVALAPKVMETLCLLVENHGRLLPKEDLLNRLWADTFVEERNLTQNIFTLRKALGDGENGRKLIETVPRRGYRFVTDVHKVEDLEQLHVSHRKQTRISAEGSVSRQELTEAVQEVVRAISEPNTSIQPTQAIPSPGRSTRKLLVPPGIVILALLTVGVVLWGWQLGSYTIGGSVPSPLSSRPLLNFERLTDSGKVFFPAISPNEQFFAYVLMDRGQFSIELQNIGSGSRTLVVGPTEKELGKPKFSADGNYLFYRAAEGLGDSGTVFRVPIFGGTPQAISESLLSDPSVSPDGEWLAFVRSNTVVNGQELVVCRSSDGSEERVVTTRTGNRSFTVWVILQVGRPTENTYSSV